MTGLGALAIGTAPLFGGALLAIAGGHLLSGFDFRAGIREDFEILALIPEDEVERRAALRASIVERIDDLVEANTQRRRLRAAALSHEGNWRDAVVFVSAVLFTIVWWNVDHDRAVWLPMFVVLILASVAMAVFAWRGVRGTRRRLTRRLRPGVSPAGVAARDSRRS
jgi:hypothetical protein